MTVPEIRYLDVGHRGIAYRLRDGNSPTLVFLPGYASDMEGAKATALDVFAEERRLGFLRFDYSGTGSSSGVFAEGTLAVWLEEALALVDGQTDGPLVIIGSSMGGWLALHVALQRPERVQALVGIAAAPDFTDWGFSGRRPAADVMSDAFWTSGQEMRLLGGDIDLHCPVRLLHGDADSDVPLDVAFRTMARLRSADVQLTVIKDGGHRLSEPREIGAILRNVAELVEPQP